MENRKEIYIDSLSFSYSKEKEILENIELSFPLGKKIGIIGSNGCVKSTLINLIAGILTPDKGKITLEGKDIKKYKGRDYAKRVAVVHQQNIAPGDLTVEKILRFGRTPYQGLFSKNNILEDREAISDALQMADIVEYANRPISSLSGGQLQRVWLAMALAQKTDILLLDEITTYLDIHYQLKILNLISKLNKNRKITVIMVLHDINQAVGFCDEVIIMKDGYVLANTSVNGGIDTGLLKEAFNVKAKTVSIDGKPHYIFLQEGE